MIRIYSTFHKSIDSIDLASLLGCDHYNTQVSNKQCGQYNILFGIGVVDIHHMANMGVKFICDANECYI